MNAQPAHKTDAYRQPVDGALATLGTDEQFGVSEEEARSRLEGHGRNELAAEKPAPAWRKFPAQFQDVLIIWLAHRDIDFRGLWLYERESALPYESDRHPCRRPAQRNYGLRSASY